MNSPLSRCSRRAWQRSADTTTSSTPSSISTSIKHIETHNGSTPRVAAGEDPGPLAGVPFGVKDLDDCAGMPTGRGSLWYSGGPPLTSDSIHVRRLRNAGAVAVGKTAVPEFGFWAYTNNRVTGVTRNPWDVDANAGWIKWRVGGGGFCRSGAVRHLQRRRRVNTNPGGVLRIGRAQAVFRPHPRPAW